MKLKSLQFGFTLVELLIVIVVIGILSSLVINVFADAQRQASNAKTVALARVYRDAFIAYAIENGDYPAPRSFCLGTGYPDLDSDGVDGDCASSPDGAYNKEESEYMEKILPFVGGDGGEPSHKVYSVAGYSNVGVAYEDQGHNNLTLDGVAHDWWLTYQLGGADQDCTMGPVIDWSDNPNFSSDSPPSSGASENWPDAVKCWVPLPDPSML